MDTLQNDTTNEPIIKSHAHAQALPDQLDAEFILATKFLADILSTISSLCKVFQSDYVALSDVHQELNKAIDSITVEFISYPKYNILSTFGFHLCEYLDEITIAVIPDFVKEFAQAMVINLPIQEIGTFDEDEIV
ncbi:5704_t:CDS:2 [Ambispora gerdemannii]|uniref:5704_t:CDS:1 n=1 Tax=Ambispora gerdemannii TaxID=144530 RepID=A0A9N9B4Z8_9GLOM|nr:5704_t:CDS:2 [Ambispora gerdemannii]